MAIQSHVQPNPGVTTPSPPPRSTSKSLHPVPLSPPLATASSQLTSSTKPSLSKPRLITPQRPPHHTVVDHPTDGSPLEESVISDPATYNAYAELLATGLSPSPHPTPGASHDDPSGSAAPRHDDPQAQESSPFPNKTPEQVLAGATPATALVPFPAPNGVPVAYFAGPGGSIIAIPQIKTKRRQVKNACTNCQKACKKCDEVRPCTRCVKYNTEADCVDSQRKERKKGVKRGPYKKRPQKGEDFEAQNQLAAAAAVAAASAAAQISMLTSDNTAALQAMGGIIYSYQLVQQNASGSGAGPTQPTASGSGTEAGEAGPSASREVTSTDAPQEASSSGGASSSESQPQPHGVSLQPAGVIPVPPPGPTAASYAFHPHFYLPPLATINGPPSPGGSNNRDAGPSQGRAVSPHHEHTQQQAQQYYASIAAFFGGSASGSGSGPSNLPPGGVLLPPFSSLQVGSRDGSGPSSLLTACPSVSPSLPSNQHILFQLSPPAMATRHVEATAAADDPIERGAPTTQARRTSTGTSPVQRSLPLPVPTTVRATTPVMTRKPKGEKRKRDKSDLESPRQSSGDEQRLAVRPKHPVGVE